VPATWCETRKLGVGVQSLCILDASGIDTRHIRYLVPVLNLYTCCSNLFVAWLYLLDLFYIPCILLTNLRGVYFSDLEFPSI